MGRLPREHRCLRPQGHLLLPCRRPDVQAPEPADRAVTRRTLPGAHLPFLYDQVSQLHSLAERIHNAADELPLTDSVHSGVDNLDDLDDRVREVTGLITHVTTAAAFAARTVRRGRAPEADISRRTVTQLTLTVGALGHALADLGDAVAHAGALHQLAAAPRSTQRTTKIESTRALLHARIDSTRDRLNKAGGRLHQQADRLAAAPTPNRSPSTTIAIPATPASPATSRSR
ncbi:hypothetical protein [Streptomyces arenae]|uniref:hypothetical protein n=1 Tax=Streptomyces arenae TaxID=29301 RepID=UPI002659B558|nr:hypothetical protein [Streptomyces arenae]MCG7207305.1 hypothetical protein [Streptomyces arenae]